MAPRTTAAFRLFLGLGLASMALALGSCRASGDKKLGFPVPGDHLVYVMRQGPIPDVTVHVMGNPKNSGDQLAWAAVDGTPIVSVTMPDPGAPQNPPCPAPTWNPYLNKETSPSGYGTLSGALNVAGLPSGAGPWCVPYSVKLQNVTAPVYGRIIIMRP